MIKNLIRDEKISIHFQPIITIKDKSIFAYEALCRARDCEDNPISPVTLFDHARKECMTLELDNYLREKAVEKFKPLYEHNKHSLLFLNMESSFIDEELKDNLLEITKKYDIPAQNIVIEIKEDVIRDSHYLENFVKIYKKHGFILAIDDFGAGYSSFDRLSIIKPDIVKIDRCLIYDIQNVYINKQILSAISSMCHSIGALVLAEGVEERDEVLTCMQNHIDIFQGYWFCKPKDEINQVDKDLICDNIEDVGNQFKINVQSEEKRKKRVIKKIKKIVKHRFERKSMDMKELFEKLNDLLRHDHVLEAIYVLDYQNGIQIGDTLINTTNKSFYLPTKEGHDHSLKEYYYMTKESIKSYNLGKKYISQASGNSCKTYSIKLNINNFDLIVCFDLIGKYILSQSD